MSIWNKWRKKDSSDQIEVVPSILPSPSKVQKKQFDRMIGLANKIFREAQSHPDQKHIGYYHPIFNFIKLLGMKLQTAYITNLLYDDDHGEEQKYPRITPELLFFEPAARLSFDGRSFFDLIYKEAKVAKSVEIDLKRDLVLPWPWDISRYVDSITSIGESRPWGNWKQDQSNHNIQVFLPVGISIVAGGNHSITSGIINGEGTIVVNEVYDLSEIYNYVYTDGIHYRRQEDDAIISEVVNVEFAVIFEVGKLMIKHGVSR